MKYTLSDRAYCKLILHALKHPLRSVCGALVGKANGDVVEVIDAIPYLHSTVSVAPNAEIALEQSAAYAATSGNTLVGYYHANERMDDDRLGKHATRIADCVERSGGAPGGSVCALLVDASALAEATERGTGRAGSWRVGTLVGRPRADEATGETVPPPLPLRTNRIRRVLYPVLIGHAASFTPY